MKKIILALSILFLGCLTSHANLYCEEEYWIEEINKTGFLTEKMLSEKFVPSPESFAKNPYGGSKSEIALWRKIIATVAKVIQNNSANLKNVRLELPIQPELREYHSNTILNALIHSKTVESLEVQNLEAKDAHTIAEIIKRNNVIEKMILDYPEFTDQGATEIAQALRTNNSLQMLSLKRSEFSMSSRKKIKEAWNVKTVEGRVNEIKF